MNNFFSLIVNPLLASSSAASGHFCEQLLMSAECGRDSVFLLCL